MNSATKVGEIFTAAGQAFTRLGDLTMQLHCNNAESASGKWTDEEIDMLHTSIMRFSDDLSKISLSIKNRTVSQIRQALKKKAFEDAGIPAKQVPVQQVQHVIQTVQQLPIVQQQTAPQVQQHQVFKSHIIQSQQQQQQQQQLHQNSSISTSTLPVVQQQQPQAVHIQHVQHIMPVAPVTTTQQTLLQTQPKQIILQPQTTTVTIKQFQQMQQQKAAALAAAQAAAAAAAANAPTITENIIIQQPTTTTTAHAVAAATSATAATTTSAGTVVVNDGAVVSATTTAAPTNTSTGLKCGPDVSMTLNRINVQENEVDVEECLPAEVVKLDFASEEVAG